MEPIRKPIREWARINGISVGTIFSWTRYLPPNSGVRIGTAWALTEKEFMAMVAAARSHKRGRPKKI